MATLFAASSRTLSDWAEGVGLTKHIYKLALSELPAKEAVAALNAARFAGADDWKLVKAQAVEAADEAPLLARLAQKEKAIDPGYYPKIKGAAGLFKIRPANVDNHLMVQRALAGEEKIDKKLKPEDIGQYLIQNALP